MYLLDTVSEYDGGAASSLRELDGPMGSFESMIIDIRECIEVGDDDGGRCHCDVEYLEIWSGLKVT